VLNARAACIPAMGHSTPSSMQPRPASAPQAEQGRLKASGVLRGERACCIEGLLLTHP